MRTFLKRKGEEARCVGCQMVNGNKLTSTCFLVLIFPRSLCLFQYRCMASRYTHIRVLLTSGGLTAGNMLSHPMTFRVGNDTQKLSSISSHGAGQQRATFHLHKAQYSWKNPKSHSLMGLTFLLVTAGPCTAWNRKGTKMFLPFI